VARKHAGHRPNKFSAGRQNVLQLAGEAALAGRERAVEGGGADGEGIAAGGLQFRNARRAIDAAGADQAALRAQAAPGGLHEVEGIGLRRPIGQKIDAGTAHLAEAPALILDQPRPTGLPGKG